MTYDDAEDVRETGYKRRFNMRRVAMKNTHHAKKKELLIGQSLDWVEEIST